MICMWRVQNEKCQAFAINLNSVDTEAAIGRNPQLTRVDKGLSASDGLIEDLAGKIICRGGAVMQEGTARWHTSRGNTSNTSKDRRQFLFDHAH